MQQHFVKVTRRCVTRGRAGAGRGTFAGHQECVGATSPAILTRHITTDSSGGAASAPGPKYCPPSPRPGPAPSDAAALTFARRPPLGPACPRHPLQSVRYSWRGGVRGRRAPHAGLGWRWPRGVGSLHKIPGLCNPSSINITYTQFACLSVLPPVTTPTPTWTSSDKNIR